MAGFGCPPRIISDAYSDLLECFESGGCGAEVVSVDALAPRGNLLTGVEGLMDLLAGSAAMRSLGGEDFLGTKGLRVASSLIGNIGRDLEPESACYSFRDSVICAYVQGEGLGPPGARLLGTLAKPIKGGRTGTILSGGKAAAKSIFPHFSKGKKVVQGSTDAGGVRNFTADSSVAIRMESTGKINIDLNALGVAEDIHFP